MCDSNFTGLEPSSLCITKPETITQAGPPFVPVFVPPRLVVSAFADFFPDVKSLFLLRQGCDVSLSQNRHNHLPKSNASDILSVTAMENSSGRFDCVHGAPGLALCLSFSGV